VAAIESMTFHHIGVAVSVIDDVLPFYLRMGYVADDVIHDPEQNVWVCVLNAPGKPSVELLAPYDASSPVNNILTKSGPGPYHICYVVPELDEAIQVLKGERFMLVSRPKVSNAFGNRCVCFLFRKDIGLLELIEENT